MNRMGDSRLRDTIGRFKRQYFFAKAAMFFFNTLYLLTGFGMALISFFVESKFFLSVFGEGSVKAYLMAAFLESAKICTIVVWDFINRNNFMRTGLWNVTKYWMQTFLKRSFQAGLFTMSLVCVIMVISEQFNRPQLEEIRSKDLGELEAVYQNSRKELLERQQQEKTALLQKQRDDRAAIENRYAPLIADENRGLVVERGRPGRSGEVRGSVYHSHEEMLATHTANRDGELASLKAGAAEETDRQTEQHTKQQELLLATYNSNRDVLQHKNYTDDQRVEHKAIHAGVETINQAFLFVGAEQQITPTGLVAFISLLLATLFECGIFLSFSSFVSAFLPQEFVAVEQEFATAQKKNYTAWLKSRKHFEQLNELVKEQMRELRKKARNFKKTVQ